jgi:hypothetical protein
VVFFSVTLFLFLQRIIYEEEIGKKIKKSKEENEHLQAKCRLYKDKVM